jgi:hypothetical protein
MRLLSAAAALLGSAGCATGLPLGDAPALLRFQPPELGGPTTLPEASPSGRLDLSQPCVSLEHSGGTSVLISTHEASLGRDSRGLYLQYDGRRFRHGNWVKGGGGHIDQLPVGPLQGPVPEQCRAGSFLIFYGIEAFQPSSAPPKSPPPPPIG